MREVDMIFNSMVGKGAAPVISAAVQDYDSTAENYNPEVMAWLNSTSWYNGNPHYITFGGAAAVTSDQFSGTLNASKQAIVTFEEAQYFTSVTYLANNAFQNCGLLEKITLPNTLTEIRAFAFRNCISLALTSLPSSITSIRGWAFYNCSSLALTSLPSGITSIGESVFQNCSSLALTSLPSGITSIGEHAFQNCTVLKDSLYEIPSSVTEIKSTAFKDVKFPRLKFLGLTPPTFGAQSLYGAPVVIDCQVPSASLAEYQQAMAVLTGAGLITISTY